MAKKGGIHWSLILGFRALVLGTAYALFVAADWGRYLILVWAILVGLLLYRMFKPQTERELIQVLKDKADARDHFDLDVLEKNRRKREEVYSPTKLHEAAQESLRVERARQEALQGVQAFPQKSETR